MEGERTPGVTLSHRQRWAAPFDNSTVIADNSDGKHTGGEAANSFALELDRRLRRGVDGESSPRTLVRLHKLQSAAGAGHRLV